MKPKDWLLIILLAFLLGLGISWMLEQEPSEESPAPPAPGSKEGTIIQDPFTIKLLQATLRTRPGNVLLAPNALAGVLIQLRPMTEGSLAQTLDALPLPATLQESAANAHEAACLFANPSASLNPEQTGNVIPTPFSDDFARSLAEINNAISTFTERAIAQTITSEHITPQTSLLAISALALQATWHDDIQPQDSYDAPFHNANGKTPSIRMICSKGSYLLAEDPEGEWKAVALPLRNATPSPPIQDPGFLILILPRENSARRFAEGLTPEKLGNIRTALTQGTYRQGAIGIPRMNFQPYPQDLTATIEELGLQSLFRDASPLPRLTSKLPYCCESLIQNCTVRITETHHTGNEPAATNNDKPTQQIDRPFLWLIGSLTSPAPPYALGIIENL